MKIEKIADTSIFSSDLNNDTLIYTEKAGSIAFNNHLPYTTDSLAKHIKFYPQDCFVFTTTSKLGLTVWDTQEMKILYKYKEELLNDHKYSNRCILASFDDFNLKFYDLKSRFMINSRKHPNTTKIEWNGEYIYSMDENNLSVFDFRNLDSVLFTIEKVIDFTVCRGKLYYVENQSDKKNVLHACEFDEESKVEKMKKEVRYRKIKSTYEKDMLLCNLENGIRFENFDSFNDLILNDIKPVDFHFSNAVGYVISEDSLYKIDGCIKETNRLYEINTI